jgi:hypothetical protein
MPFETFADATSSQARIGIQDDLGNRLSWVPQILSYAPQALSYAPQVLSYLPQVWQLTSDGCNKRISATKTGKDFPSLSQLMT